MRANPLGATVPQQPGMSRRLQRVGDLIRSELSTLFLNSLRDPRVKLASVSRVEVSSDLRWAKVRVSVLGSEQDRELCILALEGARGFLRSRLAASLHLRAVPELRFELDRGAEYSEKITRLLEDSELLEDDLLLEDGDD